MITDLKREREIIINVGNALTRAIDENLPVERKESFTHKRFSTVVLGLSFHMDSKGENHVLSLTLKVGKAKGSAILRMGAEETVRAYLMDMIEDPIRVLDLLPDFYRSLVDY